MGNLKFIACIVLLVALFYTSINLDKQGCKSPSEAFDLIGGGKIKRLESENAKLRNENDILKHKIKLTASEVERMKRLEQEQNVYNVAGKRVSLKDMPSTMPSFEPMPAKYSSKQASNSTYNQTNTAKRALDNMPSYYTYQRQIYPKFESICSEWRKSIKTKNGDMVSIIVAIDKEGKIISKEIEKSTVSRISEQFLLDKISKLGQLPPLPNDYDEPTLKQRVTFQHNVFGMGTVHRRLN